MNTRLAHHDVDIVSDPISPVVSASDEWSTLEEVIVGRVEGAVVPDEPVAMIQATMPQNQWAFFRDNAGKPFPSEQIEAATKDLAALVAILKTEGVKVVRPNHPEDLFTRPIVTDAWQTRGGMYAAMPRDNLIVIGNRIIEAPMSWRSRQREGLPYKALLQAYKSQGGDWIKAPSPKLDESFYTSGWQPCDEEFRSVISEQEPTFDAADFMRFGSDIVCQKSHVTNAAGIEWLRNLLGDQYRIHTIQFADTHPMHIDATIMPLRPGLLLINPERVPESLAHILKATLFKGWDMVHATRPIIPDAHCLYMTSKWINMNILSVDEERVLVEAQDEPMIQLFKRLGMKPIPVPFRNFNTFGGSFHCATCDVRRAGKQQAWLNSADF